MSKLKFASERVEKNFEKMKLHTKWLAVEMSLFASQHGVTLTFTETYSTAAEDKALNRVSDTHRTGRAFDIRVKDLSPEFIELFQTHFNTLYNQSMGAVTKSGPQLIVYKPHGTGPHFHVQIRRGYGEEKQKV